MRRRDEALLVQLADETLSGPALERARTRLDALPDGDVLVERQRRVARALGAERSPALVSATFAWPRAVRLVAAGTIAAACVALSLLAFQERGSTVERAANVAQSPATVAAPASSGEALSASVDGVRFPNWGPEFGWHATGMRRDEINGRRTTTVFYEHTGHRLAYTIVPGPALRPPAGARVVERDGVEVALYRDPGHGGHDVAVFERGGRTCVVAGHVRELETLIKLAAWNA